MRVSLVAALATNGVIGRDGDLPWRLPADLRRFRTLTSGHHLLLGRRTWESIGRPLPERRILVLTRSTALELPQGVERIATLDEGLERARSRGEDELFVGGGADVYRIALPRADRLYLTRVDAEVEGDTRFPRWSPADWTLVATEAPPADPARPYGLRFETWDRGLLDAAPGRRHP